MENIVYQNKIRFKDAKSGWKNRWAILEKSERVGPNEDENCRNTPFTSLVIRKHREGEVRATIPLSYLCVVDKQMLDKKNSAVVLVIANVMDSGDTYLIQGEDITQSDEWFNLFEKVVGGGMRRFPVKIPKILKWKYAGPGWLYFYEAQRFISVTDNAKFPSYIGTWPLQLLRKYGGEDPNKFVFEAGRRCLGGVNVYEISSAQAYDIKMLCNKVSSGRPAIVQSPSVASSTLSGPYPNQARPAERVVSMASNASSNTSKRSSGSSTGTAGTFSGGDPTRHHSLDRQRPVSDTLESVMTGSSNSIISNRSSRGSYCSDQGVVEEDSGIDTLDSHHKNHQYMFCDPNKQVEQAPIEEYMVMQPKTMPDNDLPDIGRLNLGRAMPPISEMEQRKKREEFVYDALEGASGPSELYEPMVRSYSENERKGDSYMTLKNGAWQEVQIGDSNYMVGPNSPSYQPNSPLPSPGPMSPVNGHINYGPTPIQVLPTSASTDNYMNLDQANYMNLDKPEPYANLSPRATPSRPPGAPNNAYMNIDQVSRNFNKPPPSHSNYMNMSLQQLPTSPTSPEPIEVRPQFKRKVSMTQVPQDSNPIYDTPTNHLRAYANVDNKLIAMSVANPIYGNCPPQQKMPT